MGASEANVAVLFPAAGAGSRMGGERKQFRLLGGKPLLVQTFLDEFNQRDGRQVKAVDPAAMRRLEQHSWPGNVRELERMIERTVALAGRDRIELEDLPPRIRGDYGIIIGPSALANDTLRKMIRFEPHNLLDTPPDPGRFDLILCRNVLLYFDRATRQRAFERLAAANTDPKLARDALWQAAELYDKGGSRAAAAKTYERYLRQYPEPLEPAVEARWRLAGIAKAEVVVGEVDAVVTAYGDIVRAAEALPVRAVGERRTRAVDLEADGLAQDGFFHDQDLLFNNVLRIHY